MISDHLCLGIDVGSTTVKVAALAQDGQLVWDRYVKSDGRPRRALAGLLDELTATIGLDRVAALGLTGSGGGPIARAAGLPHINELVAQTRAVSEYYPTARTVIEIGGQDSKLLILEPDPVGPGVRLVDFAMNTLCAAGTGAFLDQQAERLGVRIEYEFAALALQSRQPARIAGRCTVFAKTDMIHLQQQGVPLPDILAGLCYALTRNFKSVIGRGKAFVPPVLFQGGVAYNGAVVCAFQDVLGLPPGGLIIPKHHPLMAALGVALTLRIAQSLRDVQGQCDAPTAAPLDWTALRAALDVQVALPGPLPPLRVPGPNGHWRPPQLVRETPVYLGIDVGSISTNVVLIDEQHRVVARCYLRTAGRPPEAVRRALTEIAAEVGARVQVCAVGVTGSGRELIGAYVGADTVQNEITAQARAAVEIDPAVDTVFEIGGQDSKYIRLEQGVVTDFAMNKACAAGTGSFLEEQADRLRIDIARDFARLAHESAAPTPLGERCTVFIESDLIHGQQQGVPVPDLVAGLAYSIAQNYLNRVVNGRPVGERVFFQGGVASNPAVVAAFEQILGRTVTVPSHHDVSGAVGAAILAHEQMNGACTRFHGFDLHGRAYQTRTFNCRGCVNHCEISRVTFGDEPPHLYGARCERYDRAQADRSAAIPDLFAQRQALLLGDYAPPAASSAQPCVGVPRALLFYDLFPFWHRFLRELGVQVLLSDPTNAEIVTAAREYATAETCFPVKLLYGHVLDLLNKGVDWVFLPAVMTREDLLPDHAFNKCCPFIQAGPSLVAAALRERVSARLLSGPIDMRDPRERCRMLGELVRPWGCSARAVRAAVDAGLEAQRQFFQDLRRVGAEYLADLRRWPVAAVLVGRSYNTCDDGLSMALPYQLRKLGVLPIPIDMLPVDMGDLGAPFDNIYWRSGQAILAAARLVVQQKALEAIYVTNFACGPDSFLLSFFRHAMGHKPYLELEFDDHTAEAGVMTRCEAFFDSVRQRRGERMGKNHA